MNSAQHSSYGCSSREKLSKPKSRAAHCLCPRVGFFFLVTSTVKTREIRHLHQPCNPRILRQRLLRRIRVSPAQLKVGQAVMERLFKVHSQISLSALPVVSGFLPLFSCLCQSKLALAIVGSRKQVLGIR